MLADVNVRDIIVVPVFVSVDLYPVPGLLYINIGCIVCDVNCLGSDFCLRHPLYENVKFGIDLT